MPGKRTKPPAPYASSGSPSEHSQAGFRLGGGGGGGGRDLEAAVEDVPWLYIPGGPPHTPSPGCLRPHMSRLPTVQTKKTSTPPPRQVLENTEDCSMLGQHMAHRAFPSNSDRWVDFDSKVAVQRWRGTHNERPCGRDCCWTTRRGSGRGGRSAACVAPGGPGGSDPGNRRRGQQAALVRPRVRDSRIFGRRPLDPHPLPLPPRKRETRIKKRSTASNDRDWPNQRHRDRLVGHTQR